MAKNPDQFDAFFTPERREYYRDLHARFLLWCGRWPDDAATFPELTSWSPYVVSKDVLDGVSPQYLGFEFHEEADDRTVPRPVFHREDYSVIDPQGDPIVRQTSKIIPAYRAVLAAAANYAFVPWGTNLAHYGSVKAKKPEQIWGDAAFESIVKSGARLWNARLRFLRARTSDKRKRAREELEAIWRHVGERSGVFPSAKGGRLCGLPDSHLANLKREAEALVSEVLNYVPDADMLNHMRELANGEAALGDRDREMLRSLRRQKHPPQDAIERLEAKIDGAIHSTELARCLSFPMLNRAEIEQAIAEASGKMNKRTVAKVATTLLAGRLPITRNTLIRRIGQI